jgi:hypothetical protein
MGCFDKLLKLREAIAVKNPGDVELAQRLFQLYTY